MPTYQRPGSLHATAQRKDDNLLEAVVQAGEALVDRTQPLPKFVTTHSESIMSDLLHLWLAQRDPEFYQRLVGQEL